MILSMTGYGFKRAEIKNEIIEIEIKSLTQNILIYKIKYQKN